MRQLILLLKIKLNRWPIKAAGLIFLFVIAGNVIASQSGITKQLSRVFYWPENFNSGQVAGEYTVRMAVVSHPHVIGQASDFDKIKQLVQQGKNPWKKQYDAAMSQVATYTSGSSDNYWKTTDSWDDIKNKTDRTSGKAVKLYLMCYLSNDNDVCNKAKDWLLGWTTNETFLTLKKYNGDEMHGLNSIVLATGLGYDWLYNKLSNTEREQVNNWLKGVVDHIRSVHKENGGRYYHNKHAWNDVTMVIAGLAIDSNDTKYKEIVKYAIGSNDPASKSLVVLATNGMIRDNGLVCDSGGTPVAYECTELAHNLLSREAFWLSYAAAYENGNEYLNLFDPIKNKLLKTLDFYAPLYQTNNLSAIGSEFANDTRNFDASRPNFKPWINFSGAYEMGYKYFQSNTTKNVLMAENFNDPNFNEGEPRYCNTDSFGRCSRWLEKVSVLIFGQELDGSGQSCDEQGGINCQANEICDGDILAGIASCCSGNCITQCQPGYQVCQSGQTCDGSWYGEPSNLCCDGTCTGTPPASQPELIKIDINAKNPAVDVDSQGNLHIAYDCPGGLCYAKVTSEKGIIKVNKIFTSSKLLAASGDARVRVDKNDNVHISYNDGYAVIKPDGTLGAKKDNMYKVYDRGRIMNRMDVDSQGNAYILYQYGQAGEYKNGTPPDDKFRSIRLKKMKYENGAITQEWEEIIDAPSCVSHIASPGRMTPGNIKIDKNDIAHISWRNSNDKSPGELAACDMRGIWYKTLDTKLAGRQFSSSQKIFGWTSDYSDMEIDNNGKIYFAATSAWATDGFLYAEKDGAVSPAYIIYAPPESSVVSKASGRFGEANTLCPALKYDNTGKLYMSFAGGGDQEYQRWMRWTNYQGEDIEHIVFSNCVLNTEYKCLSGTQIDELLNLEGGSYQKVSCPTDTNKFTIDSVTATSNADKFICSSAYYYVAYYTEVNKTTLKTGAGVNNYRPPEILEPIKFTPERAKESDQGTVESNPIIGKAWGQGVFMVFEDDDGHPGIFDVYLKAVGGAVVGMPILLADFNCDGGINVIDFGILLSHWGKSGTEVENYTNGTCEKSLNLNKKGGIDENDFPGLLSCWTRAGERTKDVCFE